MTAARSPSSTPVAAPPSAAPPPPTPSALRSTLPDTSRMAILRSGFEASSSSASSSSASSSFSFSFSFSFSASLDGNLGDGSATSISFACVSAAPASAAGAEGLAAPAAAAMADITIWEANDLARSSSGISAFGVSWRWISNLSWSCVSSFISRSSCLSVSLATRASQIGWCRAKTDGANDRLQEAQGARSASSAISRLPVSGTGCSSACTLSRTSSSWLSIIVGHTKPVDYDERCRGEGVLSRFIALSLFLQ